MTQGRLSTPGGNCAADTLACCGLIVILVGCGNASTGTEVPSKARSSLANRYDSPAPPAPDGADESWRADLSMASPTP